MMRETTRFHRMWTFLRSFYLWLLPSSPLLSLATALQSSSIFGYCPPVLFYLWLLPSSPLLSLATALQSSSIFGYCPPVLFYLWLLPSSPLLSLATALQSSSIFGYCPPVLFFHLCFLDAIKPPQSRPSYSSVS